jgi:hypothetical protein
MHISTLLVFVVSVYGLDLEDWKGETKCRTVLAAIHKYNLISFCQVSVDVSTNVNAKVNVNVNESINVPSALSGFSKTVISQACSIAVSIQVSQPSVSSTSSSKSVATPATTTTGMTSKISQTTVHTTDSILPTSIDTTVTSLTTTSLFGATPVAHILDCDNTSISPQNPEAFQVEAFPLSVSPEDQFHTAIAASDIVVSLSGFSGDHCTSKTPCKNGLGEGQYFNDFGVGTTHCEGLQCQGYVGPFKVPNNPDHTMSYTILVKQTSTGKVCTYNPTVRVYPKKFIQKRDASVISSTAGVITWDPLLDYAALPFMLPYGRSSITDLNNNPLTDIQLVINGKQFTKGDVITPGASGAIVVAYTRPAGQAFTFSTASLSAHGRLLSFIDVEVDV